MSLPANTDVIQQRSNSVCAIDVLTGLSEIGTFCSPMFIGSLRDAIRDHPEGNWKDCLSRGQIRSKLWLVEELKAVLMEATGKDKRYSRIGCVYICAGWYALLGEMICNNLGDRISKIRSFDVDPHAVKIADRLMKHWNWKVKSSIKNIYELKYIKDTIPLTRHSGEVVYQTLSADLVINTSCEHLEDFYRWWKKVPDGKLVVVQNNNYFEHKEHVNCVDSLSQFSDQTPMKELLYAGKLDLTLYERYMRIGIK